MCLLCFFFSGAMSVYVEAFDEIIQGPLAQYVSLSQKIGGDVQKHVCYRSHDKHLCLVFPVFGNATFKYDKVSNACFT